MSVGISKIITKACFPRLIFGLELERRTWATMIQVVLSVTPGRHKFECKLMEAFFGPCLVTVVCGV